MRLWWKPLVTLIWVGGLVMMAGAAMSLLDRRLRVGAPVAPPQAGRGRAARPAMSAGLRSPRWSCCWRCCFAGAAQAVKPDEVLADPALEARARRLSEGLRCMVCQNQSIDESDADLARDLRILVRERLAAGDTDQQVMDYIVSRYGEFVLLKPRFSPRNALLWGTPCFCFWSAAFSSSSPRARAGAGDQAAERRGTGGAGHHPAARLTAAPQHYKTFMPSEMAP